MQTEKLIRKRFSKAQKIAKILILFSFVRCVILNGSLASGKHKKSSDIDILIISKDGRIFTTRFFVNLIAILFRIKRSKNNDRGHAGKFCFNYILTESFLKIPTGRGWKIDCYCADNYSKSQYIAGDYKLFIEFMKINIPLFDKYSFEIQTSNLKFPSKSKNQNPYCRAFRLRTGFQNSFGMKKYFDWFEKWAKNYQIKKIESDPRTKKYPNLIVYNDRELRFHPPSSKLRRTDPPKKPFSSTF